MERKSRVTVSLRAEVAETLRFYVEASEPRRVVSLVVEAALLNFFNRPDVTEALGIARKRCKKKNP